METKIFNGKQIQIRQLSKKDLGNVKKFQDFINSLINEDTQILMNKRFSLREEREWMKDKLKKIKNRQSIFLVAKDGEKVIGTTGIDLLMGRQNHVGNFGITIRKGYQGIGLGNYLTSEIIKLAKKELKPKIIRLNVFPTNKPAINLYKKYGFKKVASIPKQINYKGKLLDEITMILYL